MLIRAVIIQFSPFNSQPLPRDVVLNESNDPEVWYIVMSWEGNPYLSKEEADRLTLTLTDEEIETRRHGKFVALSGFAYKEFDPEIYMIEPFQIPRQWQNKISIDTGMDVPLSAHWSTVGTPSITTGMCTS